MRDRFLGLARDQYGANGAVDPDVQVALGTMYYMMGEYGEARNCWSAALGERPDVSYLSRNWVVSLSFRRDFSASAFVGIVCRVVISRTGLLVVESIRSDISEWWES